MALFDIPTWVGTYFMVTLGIFLNGLSVLMIGVALLLLRMLYEIIKSNF